MFKLSRDIKHMLKAAFVAAEAERVSKEKARKKSEENRTRAAALLKATMHTRTADEHADMRAAFGITAKILQQAKKKKDLAKFLGHFLNESSHDGHHHHHWHHHHSHHGSNPHEEGHDTHEEPHYAHAAN